MGRKPLPPSEVRRVISVSLKPATIEAIDHLRGDTTRSRWVEEMVGHLEAISGKLKPVGTVSLKSVMKPNADILLAL